MKLESAYPVIVTDAIGACRDFYVRHFGFEVLFESSWFIYLASQANPVLALAFMSPDHPSSPPGPEKFKGQGMFFTLQVTDAAAEFQDEVADVDYAGDGDFALVIGGARLLEFDVGAGAFEGAGGAGELPVASEAAGAEDELDHFANGDVHDALGGFGLGLHESIVK